MHLANYHSVKSVRIRSYSGPYSPAFGLNTDQNNSEYRHFLRSVYSTKNSHEKRNGNEFKSYVSSFTSQLLQPEAPKVLYKKSYTSKFRNIHRRAPVLESFLNRVSWRPGTLLTKPPTQAFFCEYCKIFKNTYFGEHLWTAASFQLSQGHCIAHIEASQMGDG